MASPFDEDSLPDEVLLLILQRVPDGKDWDRLRLVNHRFARVAATPALPAGLIRVQYSALLQIVRAFEGEFELNWNRAGKFWRETEVQKEVIDLICRRSSNEVATTAVAIIGGISRLMKKIAIIARSFGFRSWSVNTFCLARIAHRVLSPYALALLRYMFLCIDLAFLNRDADELYGGIDNVSEAVAASRLCRLAAAETSMLTFDDHIGFLIRTFRMHESFYHSYSDQGSEMESLYERQTSFKERTLYLAIDSIIQQHFNHGQPYHSPEPNNISLQHDSDRQILQSSSTVRTRLAARYNRAEEINRKICDMFEDKAISERITSSIDLKQIGQGLLNEYRQVVTIRTRSEFETSMKDELKILGLDNWPACTYLQL